MDFLTRLAEDKIKAAIERGELDDLPSAGKPLVFETNAFVPEDLRLAYKMLKDAGYLPPEMELRNEIVTLKSLFAAATSDDAEQARLAKEINRRVLRLNVMLKRPLSVESEVYFRASMDTKSRASSPR